jgi:hypothetical protein
MTWQMPPSFAKEPDFCIQLERINFFFLVSVLGRLADSPRAQRPKPFSTVVEEPKRTWS